MSRRMWRGGETRRSRTRRVDALDFHHGPVVAKVAALATKGGRGAGEQAHTVSHGQGEFVFGAVLVRGPERHLVGTEFTGRAPAFADRGADVARVGVGRRAHAQRVTIPASQGSTQH